MKQLTLNSETEERYNERLFMMYLPSKDFERGYNSSLSRFFLTTLRHNRCQYNIGEIENGIWNQDNPKLYRKVIRKNNDRKTSLSLYRSKKESKKVVNLRLQRLDSFYNSIMMLELFRKVFQIKRLIIIRLGIFESKQEKYLSLALLEMGITRKKKLSNLNRMKIIIDKWNSMSLMRFRLMFWPLEIVCIIQN